MLFASRVEQLSCMQIVRERRILDHLLSVREIVTAQITTLVGCDRPIEI